MTEIVLSESLLDIDPVEDIAKRKIQLLGVDVENVLTDYGNPEVLPGMANHLEEIALANSGLRIVLITNKMNKQFLSDVASQLPSNPEYVNPTSEPGLKKKPSPAMFNFVLQRQFPEVDPAAAAHIDDQFKAWFGAYRAGYGTFFWTKPTGEHQHKIVKAFRPVEFGIIRPLIKLTK